MSKELNNLNKLVEKDISNDFPEWYVSISFSKSRSKNYPQAVALAKMAPKYIEQTVEDNILHQAIYSEKCEEYHAFIKLYELVRNWNSSFVAINGNPVEKKDLNNFKTCYSNKCESKNNEYCFKNLDLADNPYGCNQIK